MCTVTWLHQPGSYQLFFNRDERRTRLPARPPAIRKAGELKAIYPVDGNAGGTWLGVNEHGLTVGVLNHYVAEARQETAPRTSRGRLVLDLLAATADADFDQRLSGLDLSQFAPFILLMISPARDLATHTWDGQSLLSESSPNPTFLTTSSFDFANVYEIRRRSFSEWPRTTARRTPAELEAFHASRLPEPGAYAVCMEREDAHTLSFSRVEVTAEAVRFAYADGPPATTPLGEPLELPLKLDRSSC